MYRLRSLLLFVPYFFVLSFTLRSQTPDGAIFRQDSAVFREDSTAFRQEGTYPKGYFRLPLELPVALSGTFGELRSNHFHTGLDFKTQRRTGYPVHAAADGFISRLREGASGFGKAVYIDHPNGYTTVYGHLERFAPVMATEMKQYQYENETFEADFKIAPRKIPVKKGDVIAYSGNSGSSGGPHLHFEIRHTESEEPINPLLFGLPVPDHVRPAIGGLFIYPLDDSSAVNGSNFRAGFGLSKIGESRYEVQPSQKIRVNGNIGFGIIATDQLDGAANRNGNYSIELKKDGQTIYFSETDRLNFANNRALNAHIDYGAYLMDHRRIQKSFVSTGNPLKIYKRLSNNGSAWFSGNAAHQMEYIVSDVAGNRSVLTFTLISSPVEDPFKAALKNAVATFHYDQENSYAAPEFRLAMGPNTLYKEIAFTYEEKPAPEGAWSKLHVVHHENTPVHEYFDIQIKTDPALTDTAKALVINQDRDAFVTSWEKGWAKARVREFGNFYVTLDKKAPLIKPINIYQGKNMNNNSAIVLRISDDLSGLRSYRGTIDGKWVLMEFDAKTATLKHVFDERTPSNGGEDKHTFRLLVTDMKNNVAEFEATFSR